MTFSHNVSSFLWARRRSRRGGSSKPSPLLRRFFLKGAFWIGFCVYLTCLFSSFGEWHYRAAEKLTTITGSSVTTTNQGSSAIRISGIDASAALTATVTRIRGTVTNTIKSAGAFPITDIEGFHFIRDDKIVITEDNSVTNWSVILSTEGDR